MSPQKPMILLIDDDTDLRETLADGLEMAGYEVVQASGFQNLLSKLPGMKISVIVVDLMLTGDSGATLIGYIKAHPRLKSVKSIMMSGYEHGEATAKIWKADMFLKKPVTIAKLVDALGKIGITADGAKYERERT